LGAIWPVYVPYVGLQLLNPINQEVCLGGIIPLLPEPLLKILPLMIPYPKLQTVYPLNPDDSSERYMKFTYDYYDMSNPLNQLRGVSPTCCIDKSEYFKLPNWKYVMLKQFIWKFRVGDNSYNYYKKQRENVPYLALKNLAKTDETIQEISEEEYEKSIK